MFKYKPNLQKRLNPEQEPRERNSNFFYMASNSSIPEYDDFDASFNDSFQVGVVRRNSFSSIPITTNERNLSNFSDVYNESVQNLYMTSSDEEESQSDESVVDELSEPTTLEKTKPTTDGGTSDGMDDVPKKKKTKKKKKKTKEGVGGGKKKKARRAKRRSSLSNPNLVASEIKDNLNTLELYLERPPEVSTLKANLSGSTIISQDSIRKFMSFVESKETENNIARVKEAMGDKLEQITMENKSLQFQLDEQIDLNAQLSKTVDELESKLRHIKRLEDNSEVENELKRKNEELKIELEREREKGQADRNENCQKIFDLERTIEELKKDQTNLDQHVVIPGKHNAKVEGELLIARDKISSLQKVITAQEQAVAMAKDELSLFMEKNGVQELKNKLKASHEQERMLNAQLESSFKEWSEKLQTKEETIEFFLAELTKLKLENSNAGGKKGGAGNTNGFMPSTTISEQNERPNLTDSKSNSFAFWGWGSKKI